MLLAGPQAKYSHAVEESPFALRPIAAPRRAKPFCSHKRQKIDLARNALNGSSPDSSSANKLEERILSGEFTEEGSKREKLTRPIRKLLAKDSLGPGRAYCETVNMPL